MDELQYDSNNLPPSGPPLPEGQDDTIPATHPDLDSNIDDHELYDEGLDGAAEVTDETVKQRGDPLADEPEHKAM
jgi:hypothetical protein